MCFLEFLSEFFLSFCFDCVQHWEGRWIKLEKLSSSIDWGRVRYILWYYVTWALITWFFSSPQAFQSLSILDWAERGLSTPRHCSTNASWRLIFRQASSSDFSDLGALDKGQVWSLNKKNLSSILWLDMRSSEWLIKRHSMASIDVYLFQDPATRKKFN